MAMATTSLHWTTCLGRWPEGELRETTAQKRNLSRIAAANRLRSFGFGRTFLSAWGSRRGVGDVWRTLSRLSFGGPGVDNVGLRSSHLGWGNSSLTPQAMDKLPEDFKMLEAFEVEGKVRDYELGQFGVVNDAIYAQYCQHARLQLLEHIGLNKPDARKSLAISEIAMKFLSPLKSGDRYVISTRVSATAAAGLLLEQLINKLPEREVVVSATATVIFLDNLSQ